jgi:hypothetical protein
LLPLLAPPTVGLNVGLLALTERPADDSERQQALQH